MPPAGAVSLPPALANQRRSSQTKPRKSSFSEPGHLPKLPTDRGGGGLRVNGDHTGDAKRGVHAGSNNWYRNAADAKPGPMGLSGGAVDLEGRHRNFSDFGDSKGHPRPLPSLSATMPPSTLGASSGLFGDNGGSVDNKLGATLDLGKASNGRANGDGDELVDMSAADSGTQRWRPKPLTKLGTMKDGGIYNASPLSPSSKVSLSSLAGTLDKLEQDKARSARVLIALTKRAEAIGTIKNTMWGNSDTAASLDCVEERNGGTQKMDRPGVGSSNVSVPAPSKFTGVNNGEATAGDDSNVANGQLESETDVSAETSESARRRAGNNGNIDKNAGANGASTESSDPNDAGAAVPAQGDNAQSGDDVDDFEFDWDASSGIDDHEIDSFIDRLFAVYATTKDNQGNPMMNNSALRKFFSDFMIGKDATDTIVKADMTYANEIERQGDMHFRFDLTRVEAKRGLCMKAFNITMDQVISRGNSRKIARVWFQKYSGDASRMRQGLRVR